MSIVLCVDVRIAGLLVAVRIIYIYIYTYIHIYNSGTRVLAIACAGRGARVMQKIYIMNK
jgi:hypothetical protein